MVKIDDIMDLLDWNNSTEKQEEGIKLACDVKCISVFLQPGAPYGKNIWDNCAIILSKKTDDELRPYLIELLEWLQDMNWPGAFCILDRMQKYADTDDYNAAIDICLRNAQALQYEEWEDILKMLKTKNSIWNTP
ncbi:MAG: DUF5071 domain-containing protein [Lachnospiraceae bacterium]|nr:DUF5071 domain-containing protein [Lachnospiraceae bacterium]